MKRDLEERKCKWNIFEPFILEQYRNFRMGPVKAHEKPPVCYKKFNSWYKNTTQPEPKVDSLYQNTPKRIHKIPTLYSYLLIVH